MASFGTVTFSVERDDFQESREARVTVIDIPGGDNFYVDRAGRGAITMRLSVVLPDSGQWSTLTTLLGQERVLAIETLDSHNAVLMSVSRSAPFIDGQIQASAQFVITDA